jgi:fructokinase
VAKLFAAIEGGGTKFIVSVGRGLGHEQARARIPTTTPDETLAAILAFLEPHRAQLVSVGVGMFGPLELNPQAGEAYGGTLATPKPGWSHVPLRARLAAALGVPVIVETDVNAAAIAESRRGVLVGADPAIYITVGTGIGGGVLVGARPIHGLLHPELGHLIPPTLRGPDGKRDDFEGVCPFHGHCVEGLASGPAILARTGQAAEALRSDHPVWPLVAGYLAHMLHACVLVVSPQRIAIGGGVAKVPHLLPRVRQALAALLAGYVPRTAVVRDLEHYLVAPALGDDAGLAGAYALAADAMVLG